MKSFEEPKAIILNKENKRRNKDKPNHIWESRGLKKKVLEFYGLRRDFKD